MTKRKVIVVDDERLVADTIALIFRRRGFECKVAYSGSQAIEQAIGFSPSLLLCDISMPGMDGVDVARSITATHPECRVLMMTGYYSRLQDALEKTRSFANPAGFTTKPVHPEALLEQADTLLASA